VTGSGCPGNPTVDWEGVFVILVSVWCAWRSNIGPRSYESPFVANFLLAGNRIPKFRRREQKHGERRGRTADEAARQVATPPFAIAIHGRRSCASTGSLSNVVSKITYYVYNLNPTQYMLLTKHKPGLTIAQLFQYQLVFISQPPLLRPN
jgi:hypothetical protein